MPYVTQTDMESARKELEKELPIAITPEMAKEAIEEYQNFPLVREVVKELIAIYR